jgi:NO-binding membrane sensor protein with MHYT domain
VSDLEPDSSPDKMFKRIRAHVKRHERAYCLGTGVGVGVVVMLAIRKPIVISVAPVFNNSNQQINLAGHATKFVECLETGEMWKKVTEAAEAAGVGISAMSKHLNGHEDNINGLHYKIIGIGTTG